MSEHQYTKTCPKCHRAYMSGNKHVCKEEDIKDKDKETKRV